MTTPSSEIPQGWYPNPLNADEVRYWDGKAWTPDVMPKDTPPPTAPTQSPRIESTTATRSAAGDVSQTVMRGDVHPVKFYLGPFMLSVLLGSLLILAYIVVSYSFNDYLFYKYIYYPTGGLPKVAFFLVWAVICSPLWFIGLLQSRNLSVELTNRKVLVSQGVLAKKSSSLQISQFESTGIDRPVLGRMLGYAKVTYVGTGGSQENLPPIRNFEAFHAALENQIEQDRQR